MVPFYVFIFSQEFSHLIFIGDKIYRIQVACSLRDLRKISMQIVRYRLIFILLIGIIN